MQLLRSCLCALLIPAGVACKGKESQPTEATKTAADEGNAPEKAASTPEPTPAPEAQKPGPGPQVRDPAWFHPNVWPGATVEKSGRSGADPAGLYSSQILFALPDGTTTQQCADTFTEKLKADVANLAPDPRGSAGGRVTLRGETEHYRATVVCGEVEGKQKAYLSYSWTKLPTP